MLAAEAMRLAAIEVLCPTASIGADGPWPTLARHRVYDSAPILPSAVAARDPYTPYLSLYSEDARVERRGESAPVAPGTARAVLAVVAELGVIEQQDGETFVAPMGEGDAGARLVLGALCAQVRKALTHGEAGALFRTLAVVEDLRLEALSLPQFDIRLMRTTMRFTCLIRDDHFTDAAGLPEPLAGLAARLPAGSYAKGKLAALAAAFAATERTALDAIRFATGEAGTPAGSVGL